MRVRMLSELMHAGWVVLKNILLTPDYRWHFTSGGMIARAQILHGIEELKVSIEFFMELKLFIEYKVLYRIVGSQKPRWIFLHRIWLFWTLRCIHMNKMGYIKKLYTIFSQVGLWQLWGITLSNTPLPDRDLGRTLSKGELSSGSTLGC